MTHQHLDAILKALLAHQKRLLHQIDRARLSGAPCGKLEADLWESRGRSQAMRDYLNGVPLVFRRTDFTPL